MTTADRSVTGSRGPGRPYLSEADLMRACQLRATELGFRLWRNNVAESWVGTFKQRNADGSVLLLNARPLHAGLAIGASDLIGIGPGGRFLSPEIKSAKGRMRGGQQEWLDMVTRLGGIAGVVRSLDDLEALLCQPR